MDWKEDYKKKVVTFEDAAKQIRSGDHITTALGVGACTPAFYDAIFARHEELRNVKITDTVQLRPTKLYDPNFMKTMLGKIDYLPGFGVATVRKIFATNMTDFQPLTSSEAGNTIGTVSDVFICMVTPPNAQGFVNLGLTNFYSMDLIKKGRETGKLRFVIGEVNENMPVIYGNNWYHVSDFDLFVENPTAIPAFARPAPGEREKKIGRYVLDLINDGDTIQMGIGAIPEAVVAGLEGKKDLGIHTEMFPMGLPELVNKGVVTNDRKLFHKGVTIATVCIGDQSLYDYVKENPRCEFYPASFTNNPGYLAQQPNLIAINMALLVDLSGQIVSEGIGHRMVSAPGGQLDFQIGATFSKGGKAITLVTAARETKDNSLLSSIVPELPPGSPVTVPRHFADYVVTEYGIAHLRYKSRRQRAEALINIAHPDLREELRKSLKKNFYM